MAMVITFHLQTLEKFSQPDGTEEYYCAQNEENEDKNRYPQILPSKQLKSYLVEA